MRVLVLLAWLALAPAAALAQVAAGPSAEIISMRDRFEAEFLRMERSYEGDESGLREQAARIGEWVYSHDWEAVRAEASRSYAALPELDLSRYAGKESVRPWADLSESDKSVWRELPAGALAAMRLYDAQQVGYLVANLFALPHMFDTLDLPSSRIGAIFPFAPTRIYRGRFEGRDVIAARVQRVFVIAPYIQHPRGMLVPDMAAVRLYDAD